MRNASIALVLALIISPEASGDVKFTKLSDNQFVVHHRKKTVLGAEAKATKTAYREAASVCIAAGYSHMEIQDLNVGERMHGSILGGGRGASTDIRIKLHNDPTEESQEEKDLIE